MPTNQQEVEFGTQKEILLKPLLETFWGKELTATKHYDTYDFIGKDITIELKSRRTEYSRYPTTIVSKNKIDKISQGEKVVFVFNFTDGIYYWEYTENDYDTIMIKRKDRPKTKPRPHLAIPIKDLVKLEY